MTNKDKFKKLRGSKSYLDTVKNYPWVIQTMIRDNFKCVKCGIEESLLVHHLDESRKNGQDQMNNDLSNLVTVCRKCHATYHYPEQSLRKEEIKSMRQAGMALREIGKEFGISHERVRQILQS